MHEIKTNFNAMIIRVFALILAVTAPLYAGYLILNEGANIPFWDAYYDAIPIMMHIKLHTFLLHELWGEINFHRSVIPRIINILSYSLFSGNVLFLSLFTFLCQAGQLIILGLLIQKSSLRNKPLAWLFIAAISWLIFPPQANQVWYWSLLDLYPIALLFYTLGLYILCVKKTSLSCFLSLIILSWLATFTCGNAIAIWPAIIAGMLVAKKPKKWIVIYAIVAIITLVYYMKGFYHPVTQTALWIRMLYVPCFLGGLYGNGSLILSIIFGILGLVIYGSFLGYCLKNREMAQRHLFWLLLPALSLISGLMASMHRIEGMNWTSILSYSLEQRYLLLTSSFWCSCLYIMALYWNSKMKPFIISMLCVMVACFALTAYNSPELDPSFINTAGNVKTEAMALENNYYIINAKQLNTQLWWSTNDIGPHLLTPLKFLKQNHYNLFVNPSLNIIGQSVNQLELTISTVTMQGSFSSLNQVVQTNYDVRNYGFLPGLEIFGSIKDNRDIEQIYIIGPQNIVYGLAIPQLESHYRLDSQSYSLWHGFVAANLACKPQIKLQAYVKMKNSSTLYPLNGYQVLQHSDLCS